MATILVSEAAWYDAMTTIGNQCDEINNLRSLLAEARVDSEIVLKQAEDGWDCWPKDQMKKQRDLLTRIDAALKGE